MLQKNWKYLNIENQIVINKISNIYSSDKKFIKKEGNLDEGRIEFKSVQISDDVWGADSDITIEWKKLEASHFHLGKIVNESIQNYALINVTTSKIEKSLWHLSHEMTIWYGNRQQMNRRRYFVSKVIHATFFCELTQRLFHIHANCLANAFDYYKEAILNFINSIQCHAN
ncbi:hypothetical protein DSAG12_02305 [Promethearchaeum syntrophicum]|uniref:Uncharacterized protein n=1 Tax=Promethearchaeum syntrophicum TaxID=2594042 RepID=A0A5B9DBW6_9ARCH|nr:hypothetical protein [Candidatus Prometheoarchaeum syntrophicum]QEE16475.1 hypothetical protein DSAG12_02305 [Candidatus Prometheoarchaeum syntrophicum]